MSEITNRSLLVVEGMDEQNLLEVLLERIGVSNFKIEQVGGKDNFRNKLPALVKSSGFLSHVKTLVVICDADNNAQGAFDSIKDIVKKAGLEVPPEPGVFSSGSPRTGIYIMPGSSDKGMLEDLCLCSVNHHPAMVCVEEG